MTTTKPTYGWAIRHWRGHIYVDTVCKRRCDAIATFKRLYRQSDKGWRKDVKFFVHKAVRVQIIPTGRSEGR